MASAPAHAPSVDPDEIAYFEKLGHRWCDAEAPYWPLHRLDGFRGCHIGTDEKGEPNARMFAEACLPDGMRVESNPGANKVHSHKNDVGHPDEVDRNAWCLGMGSAKGACVVAAAPPCTQSAMCKCG